MKLYLGLGVLLFFILIPSFVSAGSIFGQITDENDTPIPNARILITISKKQFETKSDQNGTYDIYVTDKGKCSIKIKISNEKNSNELYIYSLSSPAEYNFSLEDDTLSKRRD